MSTCLYFFLIAAVTLEVKSSASVHSGAMIEMLNGSVYRGHWSLNYVGEFPRVQIDEGFGERRASSCLYNAKTEYGRKKSQICDYMKNLQSLQYHVTDEISNLLRVSEVNPSDSRKERSFLDVLEWVIGSSTSSAVKQVVESQKKMDERIRLLRYNAERQNSYEGIISNTLNEWGGNVSDFVASLDSRAQLMQKSMDKEGEVIGELSFHSGAILVNMLKLTHILKQQMIFADCSSGKVPKHVINATEFEQYLRNISSILQNQGMTLALGDNDIHAYLNEEVATCHISAHSYIVNIKIPITFITDVHYKIYEMHPLNFAWEGEQCRLWTSPQLFLFHSKTFDVINLNAANKDLCKNSRLCRIPRISEHSEAALCIGSLMRGYSLASLKSSCSFHCDRNLPRTRVTAVGEEIYSVSSTAPALTLKCNSHVQEVIPSITGAMKIHVNCNCSLHEGELTVVSRSIPCVQISKYNNMTVIVPALWTENETNVSDVDRASHLFSLHNSTSIDLSWKQKIPYLRLPSPTFQNATDNFWKSFNLSSPSWSILSFMWHLFLSYIAIHIAVKLILLVKKFNTSNKKFNYANDVVNGLHVRHLQKEQRDTEINTSNV